MGSVSGKTGVARSCSISQATAWVDDGLRPQPAQHPTHPAELCRRNHEGHPASHNFGLHPEFAPFLGAIIRASVFARGAATVASGVNPPDERPSVSAAAADRHSA
jgi:hypothetical protein